MEMLEGRCAREGTRRVKKVRVWRCMMRDEELLEQDWRLENLRVEKELWEYKIDG